MAFPGSGVGPDALSAGSGRATGAEPGTELRRAARAAGTRGSRRPALPGRMDRSKPRPHLALSPRDEPSHNRAEEKAVFCLLFLRSDSRVAPSVMGDITEDTLFSLCCSFEKCHWLNVKTHGSR